MVGNENISNIASELTDRHLDTSRAVDLGDSVLIVGTATRGPVNQPIRIYNPQDANNIFGPIEQGTLVRGFSEVFFSPGGVKDIRLCRITNGTKSLLELEEKLGTLENKESWINSEQLVAMKVESLFPGDIYNQVSFRQEIVNGRLTVIGFNPITALETQIPYDPIGQKEGSVSDVVGLANAINLDPNLGGVVVATANEINIEYELTITTDDVAPSGTFGKLTGNTLVVDLGDALDTADVNNDGYTDDTAVVLPSGTPVTAGNRVLRLQEVYELTDLAGDTAVELDSSGFVSVQLPYPVQVSGGTAKTFLKLDGSDPGLTGGEAKHKVVNSYIGNGDGETTEFEFNAYESINVAVFKLYRTSASGTTVEIVSSEFTLEKIGGVADNYIAKIKFANDATIPAEGSILTVTYDSEIFNLTQSASLQACKQSNSYQTYFAAGDRVTFGTAQPADIVIAYKAKKIYSIGSDVVIYDAKEGKLQFANPLKQPNYGQAGGSIIGFDYDYQPEWVNLGSGARSLQGGTNGIDMDNKQKYDILTDTYKAIEDYEVDSIVLMNTYLDDTKYVYDEETGLPVEVNAGYTQQFETFLETLQDGVNETYGIMAVKPASSPKLEDVKNWYIRLTEESTIDRTRAANVMVGLSAKHISVVAFEPVIGNNSLSFPYATTGEAVYTGLACKLPITSATTWKTIGSQVITCRFKLSVRQLDKLTSLRYVTTRLTPENTWVITDGVTAASVGSDYARFSTIRIVFHSMDVVRAAGRPFLGELFNPAKRAALETALQKGLLSMQEQGVLRKFDFRIEQTPQERVLGIARIPLVLWPEFELRRVLVTVKLSNV